MEVRCSNDGSLMTRYDDNPPLELLPLPQYKCPLCGSVYHIEEGD